MKLKSALKSVGHHIVDTTGLSLASTPIYSALEVFVSGMSVATSFESRLKVLGLGYVGFATVYAKGRDLSKKIFKVDDSVSESKHKVHDSLYNLAFNLAFATPIYLSSGADFEQTVRGATSAAVLGLFSGVINGYSIDMFRDCVGTKESHRVPNYIKKLGKTTKRFIAAGLIATSIATTAGIYKAKELISKEPAVYEVQKKSLENIVE